jgi:Activator of Hsp90 ATPase homolog 1-like protein
MNKSEFVYLIYIRTSPEQFWSALTSPDFMKQYWFGMHCQTDWKTGSSWRLLFPDGRVPDTGEIVEIDPPRRLVLKWRNDFRPELKSEGSALHHRPGAYARCREADYHPCHGSYGVEVYRGRFRRLAAHRIQSQIAARNWRNRREHDRGRQLMPA